MIQHPEILQKAQKEIDDLKGAHNALCGCVRTFFGTARTLKGS